MTALMFRLVLSLRVTHCVYKERLEPVCRLGWKYCKTLGVKRLLLRNVDARCRHGRVMKIIRLYLRTCNSACKYYASC